MSTGRVVGKDFNDILHLSEKIGGLLTSLRRCTLFQQCINNYDLIDTGCSGYPYTLRGLLGCMKNWIVSSAFSMG